ncbi:fibronectin type III domain-containing protein [Paenibacillus nasutitermitis]|uniref:Fibronectin type-III domain-containing protein n=1 Tax=Paenibacillus nasutitermitis TaxID=1652958 RepID=A0A916YWG0_9BACL|nr:fibronectin type III domain-containing protein [Paenibacillus nasutitermitis]GGD64204.1 hypothetical protein GCM10010911_22440 [Paenibacillus nasutitermitis]
MTGQRIAFTGRKAMLKKGGAALIMLLTFSLLGSLVPAGSMLPAPSTASADGEVSYGNLAGMDDLGRILPRDGQVPAERSGKYVGIFYFLWMGSHGTAGPYDVTQIRATDPGAVNNGSSPLWGALQAWHFWGKPLYDYYLSDDAWVLRKHVQMLTDAKVDFLVFDATNAFTYKTVYDKLFAIMDEYRLKGYKVPKVAFYTNSSSGTTITSLYNDIYAPGRYPELWFNWKGKPLMIGDPTQVSTTIRNFFTFRLNQWPNEAQKTNGFPWIEFQRPQRVFYNDQSEKEIINVSVAQHQDTISMSDTPFYGYGQNWGRNYHNGANDNTAGAVNWGYNAVEQWDYAISQDPQIIFVTGWNEWVAQRQPADTASRPIKFVDAATLEFSRDIEPMSGGYGDNYYMQMMGYIRKFKGLSPQLTPSAKKTITINTDFTQWDNVTPEYRDYTGDTVARNNSGWGSATYTNNTGRNDFDIMKVARDDNNLYFYASTVNPITAYTDAKWMRLLINTDGNSSNGWKGYDYIINRSGTTATTATVEQSTGGWNWTPAGTVNYKLSGNKIHFAIPRSMIGLGSLSSPMTIQFKWSDNMQTDGNVMDFYVNGDTAPFGRLNYVYTEAPALPAPPLDVKAGSGNAQVNLNWSPIVGATSYNVKRSLTAGGPYTTISTAGSVTTPSYADTGLTNGTTYYYVVSAVKTAAGESMNSSEVSAVPMTYTSGKDWNFNTNGNLEGWSMVNQATGSVSGGLLSITSSGGDPFIHSPDSLGITNPWLNRYIRVRMQNGTGNAQGQIYFTTTADSSWTEAKSKKFTISTSSGYNEYVIDMGTNAAWIGTIKQIRFDPSQAAGSIGVDYIRITSPSGTGTMYHSANGFSSTQGANQWSYKYSADLVSYTNMTWSSANSRWEGASSLIANTWQHPNNASKAVRAWTAPTTGTINIVGNARKSATSTLGNGVNVKVLKNTTQIWPATGWQLIGAANTTGYNFSINTSVSTGDVLYFIVDANGEHSYDTTDVGAAINYQ